MVIFLVKRFIGRDSKEKTTIYNGASAENAFKHMTVFVPEAKVEIEVWENGYHIHTFHQKDWKI